jgi:magnesium transporter
MLTIYDAADNALTKRGAPIGHKTVWVDLLDPNKEEDVFVEGALGIAVPTREEMDEIEASSRLYQEGGAYYMTAVVLHQSLVPTEPPISTPITFILAGQRLVTVRYAEPRAIDSETHALAWAHSHPTGGTSTAPVKDTVP